MNKPNFTFTPPTLCDRKGDMRKYWYVDVTIHIENMTHRLQIQSGKEYGMVGSGNKIRTKRERRSWFRTLQSRVAEHLRRGDLPKPLRPTIEKTELSAVTVLRDALERQRIALSKTTFIDYESRLNVFCRWLDTVQMAHVNIEQIERKHIEQFLDTHCRDQTGTNRNNYKNRLRAIFGYLGLPTNPCANIKRAKESEAMHTAYTKEQAQKILQAMKGEHPAIYLACLIEYYIFIRPGELLNLQWSDIDFKRKTVTVKGENSKVSKNRTLPMHPELVTAFEQYKALKYYEGDTFVFCNRKGERLNDDFLKTQFKRFKERNPDLFTDGQTFYSFKHTGCIAFYENTKDIYLLCRLCGHSNTKTTEKYLRSLGLDDLQMDEFVPAL